MDYEADVIVVGYGAAGAATALTAHEAGAKVLMLEKNAEGGGNTRYSGGSMRTYLDRDKAIDYFETLCEGTTERATIKTFVDESSNNPEWIKAIGGNVVQTGMGNRYPLNEALAAYPFVRGADGIGPRVRVKGSGPATGVDLWGVLSRKIAEAKISVIYSSPACQLLMSKDIGVTGLIATNKDKEFTVRCKRGVVLTCGGFEYDQNMHLNYFGQKYFGLCNPGNSGDGIRLAAEVGADLWHMNAVAATLGYKFPEFVCGIKQSMPYAGYIYVDQNGKRFMDELGTDSHLMWAPTAYINTHTLQRERIPCYVIFDDDTRTRGAVGDTGRGKISDVYQWSKDNDAEIRKGWIKAADSIAGLAAQINVLPERLQKTVADYNLQCVGGYDPEHGRAADTLIPLGRPPYYAIDMWPCLFNTQGGPKRNSRAQVLDVKGRPIKRLYSAGELGSLWHRNYPGAGNISEALAFGRIAGKNVANEQAIQG